MTSGEEFELTDEERVEYEAAFAKCKTFQDFRSLLSAWGRITSYEAAFSLITTAEEAFDLAQGSDYLDWETHKYSIRALKKCLELANLNRESASDANSLYYWSDDDTAWFHLYVFEDAELVKMLAKLHGFDIR
jgi:hypothetical protein